MLDITAFAALIKRKRGELRLTQETLAQDVFGDSARKADISRLENARVNNPQEATIQKLCKALKISPAELDALRIANPTATQLDQIPTLNRNELELLASRFEAEKPHDRSDAQLREFLTLKAEEYRAYRAQIDRLDDRIPAINNLKGAAQDAADKLDFDQVITLLTMAHETELEIAAETAELRADTELLRGNPQAAFTILAATADSFASVDLLEPTRRRIRPATSCQKTLKSPPQSRFISG